MDFSKDIPLYKQIEEYFYKQILNRKWMEGDNLPSVREVAVLMEVNPNTALRAFHELQDREILFNKRGVGYFVADNAFQKVQSLKKQEFLEVTIPSLFRDMKLLEISFHDLKELYQSNDSP
ncbi:MAG: GntR family transcriptional regulator [Gracilimonas sp.]|nr:GntR family transcriptional regulator [Gracilimonas sp.]